MPKTFEDKATTFLMCALCLFIGIMAAHYFIKKPKLDFDDRLKASIGYKLEDIEKKCADNICVINKRVTAKDFYFPSGDESSDK